MIDMMTPKDDIRRTEDLRGTRFARGFEVKLKLTGQNIGRIVFFQSDYQGGNR